MSAMSEKPENLSHCQQICQDFSKLKYVKQPPFLVLIYKTYLGGSKMCTLEHRLFFCRVLIKLVYESAIWSANRSASIICTLNSNTKLIDLVHSSEQIRFQIGALVGTGTQVEIKDGAQIEALSISIDSIEVQVDITW